MTDARGVAAGDDSACAVMGSGGAECWGANYGDFGNGGVNGPDECQNSGADYCSAAPVAVTGLAGVTELSAGGGSDCALIESGPACWGENQFGQLGDATFAASDVPVAVANYP
jgi:alpha-tubulin suppressor-like RCC1 family protein